MTFAHCQGNTCLGRLGLTTCISQPEKFLYLGSSPSSLKQFLRAIKSLFWGLQFSVMSLNRTSLQLSHHAFFFKWTNLISKFTWNSARSLHEVCSSRNWDSGIHIEQVQHRIKSTQTCFWVVGKMHDFLDDSHDSNHTNMWDSVNPEKIWLFQ